MLRLLLAALAIVALGALGCKREAHRTLPSPRPIRAAAERAPSHPTAAGPVRKLEVTLQLPAGWKQKNTPGEDRCPATTTQHLLGVQFSSVHGCVIGTVEPDGPADKSGLRPGDSIAGCNGGKVTCPSSLDPLLWTTPGDAAKLEILRPADLPEAPKPAAPAAGKGGAKPAKTPPLAGH